MTDRRTTRRTTPVRRASITYPLGGGTMGTMIKINDTTTVDVDAKINDYRNGDAKIKSAIRRDVDNMIKLAVRSRNMDAASALYDMKDQLTTVRPTVEINFADVIARRVVVMSAALDMIKSGVVRPDGVPDDFKIDTADIMSRAKSIMDAIVPDVSAWSDDTKSIMADAARMAGTKIIKSRDRHDTATYIRRALSKIKIGAPVTVAQMINLGAVDGDDYRPTSGAVSARLNSANAIDGVKIEKVGDRSVLGASRTRDFTPDEIN